MIKMIYVYKYTLTYYIGVNMVEQQILDSKEIKAWQYHLLKAKITKYLDENLQNDIDIKEAVNNLSNALVKYEGDTITNF